MENRKRSGYQGAHRVIFGGNKKKNIYETIIRRTHNILNCCRVLKTQKIARTKQFNGCTYIQLHTFYLSLKYRLIGYFIIFQARVVVYTIVSRRSDKIAPTAGRHPVWVSGVCGVQTHYPRTAFKETYFFHFFIKLSLYTTYLLDVCYRLSIKKNCRAFFSVPKANSVGNM